VKTVKLFYSWQSDLPSKSNHYLILDALRHAASKIEKQRGDVMIVLDHATRGETGSVDIPSAIFKKISEADLFIGDISTINSKSKAGRKTPNPNVLIELGFAISQLGWSRIVMLFNKGFGDFPKDLPFDLSKHRIGDFENLPELKNLLTQAIKIILDKQPSKPKNNNASDLDLEKRKYKHDIRLVREMNKVIDFDFYDKFIDELPNWVLRPVFSHRDALFKIVDKSSFYLYDRSLNELLKQIMSVLDYLLSNGDIYFPVNDRDYYRLELHPSEPSQERYAEFNRRMDEIGENAVNLRKLLEDYVSHVKENYPTVKI